MTLLRWDMESGEWYPWGDDALQNRFKPLNSTGVWRSTQEDGVTLYEAWEQMGKPERFTVIGVKGLWIHTKTPDAKPI